MEGERGERGRRKGEKEKPSSERGQLELNPSPARTPLPSETFLLYNSLKSKKGFFAGPEITKANLSSVERAQLQRIQVFCSLHNGMAISYFEQTILQHGLMSV